MDTVITDISPRCGKKRHFVIFSEPPCNLSATPQAIKISQWDRFKKGSAEIRFPSKTAVSAPGQATDDPYVKFKVQTK